MPQIRPRAALAALTFLAACTDAPLPTAPGGPGRPSLSQAASGPVVTTLADPGDGSCDDAGVGDGCTLREAIAFAAAGATIAFAPGVTGTVTLTQGRLLIDKRLTISGPGAASLAVSGNHASRVFEIPLGTTVTLAELTVTGGNGQTGVHAGEGGGIYTRGNLTLVRSTVSGNSASGAGGGILTDGGTLIVIGSTISGNSAGFAGGAIYSWTATDLSTTSTTILNSTISGNTADEQGGGVRNGNGLTRVLHSTVTANRAPVGGGIISYGDQGTRTDVQGSVVAGNTTDAATPAPNDLVSNGTTTRYRSLGYNVVGAAGTNVDFTLEFTAAGDQQKVTDPAALKLGPLADNGGPTHTHALLTGSVALDGGDPDFDATAFSPALTTDQRGTGFARVVNGRIDVGGFEAIPKTAQAIAFTSTPPGPAVVAGTYTVTATGGGSGNPVTFRSETPGVCTVSESTVSFVATGTCTIAADQAGNDGYLAAIRVTQGITVEKAMQAISFTSNPPASPTIGGTYAVAASGGVSGNPVTFSSLTAGVCTASSTASGGAVAFVGVGTCTIAANQAGSAGYEAAAQVTQTLKVDYRFAGFAAPVRNDALNAAKAGQAIPLKWRLTDAAGAPVTTLRTATVTAVALTCPAARALSSFQVNGSAASGSGLQNLGGGYYQLDWKVPASYAGSCKTLELTLGEGSGPRAARFQFTK